MKEIKGRRAMVVEGEYLLRVPDEVRSPPVVLLLHGFGDTLAEFVERMPLTVPGAAILYAGGPLPVEVPRKSEDGAASASVARKIGQAWYCYDGDPDRFRDGLDEAESYLDSVLDDARKQGQVDTSRLLVVGYSMGAYVAGYFALRRSPQPLGLVLVGGRLKHEFLEHRMADAKGLHVLNLHGKSDKHYPLEKASEAAERLVAAGAVVEDITHEGGHGLTPDLARRVESWVRQRLA